MFGKLNQEWHGVPSGTELEIVDSSKMFGDLVYLCRRVDGDVFPTPFGRTEKLGRIEATLIGLQD